MGFTNGSEIVALPCGRDGTTLRGFTSDMTILDILSNLLLTMEHGTITIPSEPHQLLSQLTQQRCEPTPQGTYKFTHPNDAYDDLAWAFALAVYSYPGPMEWMTTLIGVPHRQ